MDKDFATILLLSKKHFFSAYRTISFIFDRFFCTISKFCFENFYLLLFLCAYMQNIFWFLFLFYFKILWNFGHIVFQFFYLNHYRWSLLLLKVQQVINYASKRVKWEKLKDQTITFINFTFINISMWIFSCNTRLSSSLPCVFSLVILTYYHHY